ncbi:MAG: site-2 protease family protein [Simkania sp.]|nr:site-2 protease family protein [Simkania sp.]
MITSLLYFILALIGLGFLIFIHELGHYFMARHVGMKVEAFSIGFGRPFRVWEWHGVKWQLCILPFGGYVRIAGMEKKGAIEPYQIPEGFFGKPPIARIKVALMGPLVNLVFALLVFFVIWAGGGRLKQFSEYTKIVGWVEPQSKPFKEGVAPGDQLTSIGGKAIHGYTDLIYGVLFNSHQVAIQGEKLDYWTGEKYPYCFELAKDRQQSIEQQINEVKAIQPASFLLYDRMPDGRGNFLEVGSPMELSGIQYGDRIVWVDGEIVFSQTQLSSIINQPRVLLTVQRNDETFLTRVPRLRMSDLKLSDQQRSELDDWRSEAQLEDRFAQLYFIPYNLSNDAVVEQPLTYVNEQSEHCALFDPLHQGSCSQLEKPLEVGDRIRAVDGEPITNSFGLLAALQERKVRIAVLSAPKQEAISWRNGDNTFIGQVHWKELHRMVRSIGTSDFIPVIGSLRFLNPITPRAFNDFQQSNAKNYWMQRQVAAQEQIEKIKDPQAKMQAQKVFEAEQKKLRLGIALQDAKVRYNPSPFILFGEVLTQTWQTLKALVSGQVTPKAMQGPVGIIQVIHYGWTEGVSEALFWMGVISLNLGVFNLLPIPVLDGGHICFACWEAITKKPIKAKTMERLVIPFIVLLIALLLFTTYNDIIRIIRGFF